jgi:hypothetical protein
MELAQHPAVIGSGKRSALFWFIISPVFAASQNAAATYMMRPEVVLERQWALPDLTMHALGDVENSL